MLIFRHFFNQLLPQKTFLALIIASVMSTLHRCSILQPNTYSYITSQKKNVTSPLLQFNAISTMVIQVIAPTQYSIILVFNYLLLCKGCLYIFSLKSLNSFFTLSPFISSKRIQKICKFQR